MNNFVIGTAGHIDHGKTSLIKALTGINTDTLQEEQRRGITIDLGFSYLELSSELTVGIVDVPGHEKLIKNMLSGVCGIDLILLVIAVDDGIMPQTREHFEIINHLNVENILVVLTKTDLVDENRVSEVKNVVKTEFGVSNFVNFSIYDENSYSNVKEAITSMLVLDDEDDTDTFRMPIDRVFNVKGHGVVVTGSSISGKVRIGDKLEVLPSKNIVRVKGIQVFKKKVDIAYKKTRIALNISGIKQQDLNRGKIISTPNKLIPTKILDVKIKVSNIDGVLKHLENVKFHYLASEVKAKIKLFNIKEINKGEVVYGQLLLEEELYAVNGDLGVLRKINPNITVAGVEIINVHGKFANRKDNSYVEKIKGIEEGDLFNIVSSYFKSNLFSTKKNLLSDLGISDNELSELDLDVIEVDDIYISKENFNIFKRNVLVILNDYHKRNKYELGINKSELFNTLDLSISSKAATKFLGLIDDIEVTDKVKLKSFQISLSKEENIIAKRILKFVDSNDFKPPKYKEIIAFTDIKAMEVYFTLIKQGEIVKLDDDIVLTKHMISKLLKVLDEYFEKNQILTLTDAREILNSSRRYVVPYLEYLDKIGYTKRVESGRTKKGVVN
ncbi:selenocysteine-specific translation elongation factor [Mycoplasmatota bacterium zrk1]